MRPKRQIISNYINDQINFRIMEEKEKCRQREQDKQERREIAITGFSLGILIGATIMGVALIAFGLKMC